MNEYKVIVDKSTVPVGTAEKADRVIIGSNSERATQIMQEIYSSFMRTPYI